MKCTVFEVFVLSEFIYLWLREVVFKNVGFHVRKVFVFLRFEQS